MQHNKNNTFSKEQCSGRYAGIISHILIDFSLVNRIKELHKVSVRIPPDNEKSTVIRIEGDPQGVQEAKKELLELTSRMVRTGLTGRMLHGGY